MLKPFLNYAVVIETPAGQVVGVLTRAHTGRRRWILQVHAFVGADWYVITDWRALKTARSSS